AHGDLDKDDLVRTIDAEVFRVINEIVGGVFVDGLEAIIWRDGDGFDHGAMDAVGDGTAIFGSSASAQGDADERHEFPPPSLDAVKSEGGTDLGVSPRGACVHLSYRGRRRPRTYRFH